MISTRDLSHLPDIQGLKSLSQALALLDAILCPEWEYRYYSFNAAWGTDQSLASMRNGQGDWYLCVFNTTGAVLKGFAHESAMSPFRSNPPRIWPGVLERVPPGFRDVLTLPALVIDETTFCIWRSYADSAWQRGNIQFPNGRDADGSAQLLSILDRKPQTYHHWAENYYQHPVSLEAIMRIYQHEPLTASIVHLLNSTLAIQDLDSDILEIGYAYP